MTVKVSVDYGSFLLMYQHGYLLAKKEHIPSMILLNIAHIHSTLWEREGRTGVVFRTVRTQPGKRSIGHQRSMRLFLREQKSKGEVTCR
jgi:hypothetical protein